MYYDRKPMSGTKLERAVSPECNENVASERNLKNECKKLERQPLNRMHGVCDKQRKEQFLE